MQKTSKKKELDLYTSVIKKEKAKLAAITAKAQKNKDKNNEELDSNDSIYVIDAEEKLQSKKRSNEESDNEYIPKTKIKKGKAAAVLNQANKKAKKNTSDKSTLEEEKMYKRKVQWLKDHGESESDNNDNGEFNDSH